MVFRLKNAHPDDDSHTYHTSIVLEHLVNDVAGEHFTLDWLVSNLPNRSFGMIILFLGFLTMIPLVSIAARLIILFLLLQILVGLRHPVFPKKLMARPFSKNYLTYIETHAIPVLRHVEKSIRPRLHSLPDLTRPLGAAVSSLVVIVSLLAPLPLINMPAAIIIIMMALAYIEHDGILLMIAHTTSVIFLSIICGAAYEAYRLHVHLTGFGS